jgi:hypothetical protein
MYFLTKKMVARSAYYADELNVLFLKNRKVACSTIQYSLWKATDQLNGKNTFKGVIHTRETPFVNDIFAIDTYDASKLKTAAVFSTVRNPYVRILSAYRNKVGKDPAVWDVFRKRFGIRLGVTQAELSFSDFVNLVANEPDEILDVHFCPQYLNLLLPYSKFTFVGRLEAMEEIVKFMDGIGAPILEGYRNASNSTYSVSKYYDEETITVVREKYAEDFTRLGYSTEISEIGDFDAGKKIGGDKDYLIDYILTGNPPLDLCTPEQKAYQQFTDASSVSQKLNYIRNNYEKDSNWAHLHSFATLALKQSQYKLARDIIDRAINLRSRHRKFVKNTDIFI